MKKISAGNLTRFTATAAAMLLWPQAPRLSSCAQSNSANDTYMVISRSDGGSVDMHVDGRGDHCWGTTSDDVGISIGDSKCTVWDEGADDEDSLHATVKPDKISFRLNGKSYSITDSATVKQARGLFGPLVSIEQQQSELGAKQRTLGEKQREFGRQQREVKVSVPDMSADFDKVEADAKRLSTQGGTQSELGDLQSELGDLQSRIGDLQSQAGDQQSKIGDLQSDLGDQQSKLGDLQSDLGDRSQQMAAGIVSSLRKLLSQAVSNGTAKAE